MIIKWSNRVIRAIIFILILSTISINIQAARHSYLISFRPYRVEKIEYNFRQNFAEPYGSRYRASRYHHYHHNYRHVPIVSSIHGDDIYQRGIASWYGPGFNHHETASGEIYNMYGMTAASRTIPLGTVVDVTNLRNGRTVTVKVNDRGPYVGGRIMDLSYGAAVKLGMLHSGTTRVEIHST